MRCDAGAATGVGHLVRSVALAEEFVARGDEVLFLSNLGELGWAHRQLTVRGLPLVPGPSTPETLLAAVEEHRIDLIVIDSYVLDPGCGAALRAAGVPVLAIVDGDLRGQVADLYVDQNLGAERLSVALPPGARRLAGLPYTLLRESVRERRPVAPRPAAPSGIPEVLGFFGGTDAFGAAPVVARVLAATGVAFTATMVAGRPELAAQLAGVPLRAGQSISVIGPTDELPALVAGADLVLGAAGTSIWELLCLGAAAALIWVADNQWLGYDRVASAGLAVGLGRLGDLCGDGPGGEFAAAVLRELLTGPDRRTELAARAWAAVDGRGRERVADFALKIVGDRQRARL
jgi:spore coat polysaccharide biosynthesis predicted glycosyltransferase SpsG